MDAPSANPLHEIESSKNLNLFDLDKNIASLISGYLTNKDLVNLCVTSKGWYSIFYPSLEKRLMSYFLKFVVEGQLDKAEEILSKNKKLVFLQADITDPSGRLFTRITAFQYAIWALDKEMWELILKYLPEAAAYEQLRVVEQERVDITKIHGIRLNFQPLLEAYQKYIDKFDEWSWDQLGACWRKEVGGAQRQMPAWFVYAFCEEGNEKSWPKGRFERNFTRDPKHLSWWFDGEEYGGKLGVKWGACRGRRGYETAYDRTHARTAHRCINLWGGPWDGIQDRARTSQFMSDRMDELSRFVERLASENSGEKKFSHKIK